MGIERSHTPDYFRKRAEEFRAKADNCQIERAKDALLKAARQYDQLARRAETIRTVDDVAK